MSLTFKKTSNGNNEWTITGFGDASYGDTFDKKSTYGYCIYINNNLVLWCSKKTTVIPQSTVEAEYICQSQLARQMLWIYQLMHELGTIPTLPMKMYCDNQGSIKLIKNPIISKYSKHIGLKYHFIRHHYQAKNIDIECIETENNIADIFTKPLQKTKFQSLRNALFQGTF